MFRMALSFFKSRTIVFYFPDVSADGFLPFSRVVVFIGSRMSCCPNVHIRSMFSLLLRMIFQIFFNVFGSHCTDNYCHYETTSLEKGQNLSAEKSGK